MTDPAPELATELTSDAAGRLLQAEALVRDYCRWHIAPSRTATFSKRVRSRVLLLPSLYVTAVTSVTVDGVAVDPDEYDPDGVAAGVLERLCGRWCGRVVVAFTHGYTDPPEVVTGVVQAVAQRAVDNPHSVVRDLVGPFSHTYPQTGFNQATPLALFPAEEKLLDPYRLKGH